MTFVDQDFFMGLGLKWNAEFTQHVYHFADQNSGWLETELELTCQQLSLKDIYIGTFCLPVYNCFMPSWTVVKTVASF